MLHAIPEKPQNLDAVATFVAILLSLVDPVNKHGTITTPCTTVHVEQIFQALVKSDRADLDDLAGAGNVIKTALSFTDHYEYGDANLHVCLQCQLSKYLAHL